MLYGKKIWGPKAWSLLHAFSMNNNLKISNKKKHNYYILYTSFKYIIPCNLCRKHYSDIIYYINPIVEEKITRKYLIKWVFETHNIVNEFLNKPIYPFKKFIENNNITIIHEDIFFFINAAYSSMNFDNISLYEFDQIYNFFIHFCLLYPDLKIRKKLKKLIRTESFKKIETPRQFKEWYIKELINVCL